MHVLRGDRNRAVTREPHDRVGVHPSVAQIRAERVSTTVQNTIPRGDVCRTFEPEESTVGSIDRKCRLVIPAGPYVRTAAVDFLFVLQDRSEEHTSELQ